jgi:hypothetical protein
MTKLYSSLEVQGCQTVSFQTKIPIWVNFGGPEIGKYFMAIWNILQTFEILHDHLVHFVFIWYIL